MANFDDLRRRAEEKLKAMASAENPNEAAHDLVRLLEELHIHHVELEIQNQDLREAQQHLKISREQYRELYDSAPVGYFTLDSNGTILAVNRTGAAQLGRVRRALPQKRFTQFVEINDRELFSRHLRRCTATRTGQACELRLLPFNGRPFMAHLESTPGVDAENGAPHIRTVVIDITARKLLETELEQHRHHLERLVAARTVELSQANDQLQLEVNERTQAEAVLAANKQQLEQTLAELKAAQQRVVRQERLAAVGQLAAGIAHDFNNILTTIIGHAALLDMEAGDFSPDNRHSVETIGRQGKRAAQLIRQILDFTRQSRHQPRPVDLADFLDYSRTFLERTIPEHIRIELHLAPGRFAIEADPTQLQQLLTNLAVNARDAMPEGGLLEFRLSHFSLEPDQPPPSPELPPGDWVRLVVADTGLGMAPDILPHIYEPFFSTKDVGRGTGLGLSQVYGIVQQHHGYIDVESRVNAGTRFTVYLPLAPVTGVKPAVTAPEPRQGQGEVVLVVEDDEAVLGVISALLDKLHYQTLSAANGQEALQIYRANPARIDVVLTDLVMPEMDGAGLLQALQAEEPQVKVIVMSGYPQSERIEAMLPQEVVEWVPKPPTLEDLAQALQRALR